MDKLLTALKTIPEYNSVLECVKNNSAAAVTGIGQINRSHFIAALYQDTARPICVIVQDDVTAKRVQEELRSFLTDTPPSLPGRELTLYDASVVSRGWEQKRMRQYFDLLNGKTRLQILSWDALSQRTMPPAVFKEASFNLKTYSRARCCPHRMLRPAI